MQIAKSRHLAREHRRPPFVFGTARVKPITGHDIRMPTAVSDRAYQTAIMVYRLAAPDVARWLQTRESFDFNLRNLLDDDVFTYRCGDVRPRGYRNAVTAGTPKIGQFGVNELERFDVETKLAAQRFRLAYSWIANNSSPSSSARTTGS
jgi:hypothetical protein